MCDTMSEETRRHIHVVAAVVEHDRQVLCMRKGATRYDYTAFRWEFPGGKIEPGETPRQALHRELLEEMDYDVEVGEHLMTVDYCYPDFDITMEAYRCKAMSRKLTMREHTDCRWLPHQQLLTLDWCAADLPIARMMAQPTDVANLKQL